MRRGLDFDRHLGDCMTPSLTIVAFAADRPMSPRGERALAVAETAAQTADVELITPIRAASLRGRARPLARVAGPVMLDRWEPEAWWTLRNRRARPDGALLVGFPFSPVYWAARWLVQRDIRYVVDLGDPWALTLPPDQRPVMGRMRAARCESFVWRFASAGVVTTQLQADSLRRLFPALPIVVRPNGFRPAIPPTSTGGRRPVRTLRLAHYGSLYESRLAIAPLLSGLAACGRWDSVIFTQHGEDWTGALRGLPPRVQLQLRASLPWDQVVATACEHDAAVVIGNRNPAQLPSKAVQYLTLPIPRVAVVGGQPSDALTDYVCDKPGWTAVRWDACAEVAGNTVASHLARVWSLRQLAPPASESWREVAAVLVDVVHAHALGGPRHLSPAGVPIPAPAIAAASSSHPR
jgi:hypothetical protein